MKVITNAVPIFIKMMIFGLSFSEVFSAGCPEKTRAHLTRCDRYFKCVVLPSGSHVWVPTDCEAGLIFEPTLKTCVLPGDDWECIPLLEATNEKKPDIGFPTKSDDQENVFVSFVTPQENYDGGSGDGGYIDDVITVTDDTITSQLQRLTQLIDSVDSQKKPNKTYYEIQPNQLNAFLAKYNIEQEKEKKQKTIEQSKHHLPKDGKIELEHLLEILREQDKLNSKHSPYPDTAVIVENPTTTLSPPKKRDESVISQDVMKLIVELSRQMMNHRKEENIRPIIVTLPINGNLDNRAADNVKIMNQNSDYQARPTNTMVPFYQTRISSLPSAYPSAPSDVTISNAASTGYLNMPRNPYDIYNNTYFYGNYNPAYQMNYKSAVSYPPYNAPFSTPEPPPQQFANNPVAFAYPYYNNQFPTNYNSPVTIEEDTSENYDDDDQEETEEDEPEPQQPQNISIEKKQEKVFGIGGNVYDYDTFKDALMPIAQKEPAKVAVLKCIKGIRQANETECTKYYVCNPENGALQDYTCPEFMAFNGESKICDAEKYAKCKHSITMETYSVDKNRILEAKTKRIDQEKSLIEDAVRKIQTTKERPAPPPSILPALTREAISTDIVKPVISHKPPHVSKKKRPIALKQISPSTTVKPKISSKKKKKNSNKVSQRKNKEPTCKKEGRMPDPSSRTTYFNCYKIDTNKYMKTKMACIGNVIFCQSSLLCTLPMDCEKLD